jgi:poly-gamma-glutamate synthesis protein (capsule biosynthesis protein)
MIMRNFQSVIKINFFSLKKWKQCVPINLILKIKNMEDEITLLFAGDVVCKSKKAVIILEPLKKELTDFDIFSINLEAPLEGVGTPICKSGPSLNQSIATVNFLQELGVNVVSCANNHICDYGEEALNYTLKQLIDKIVVGAGSSFHDAYQLKTKYIKNKKIGFLSFAENGYGALCDSSDNYGYAWINHEKVNELITHASSICDMLIVQVHAGVEEINIPLPEWRKRYKEIIDLGASALIATHPHVPQGWEMYNGSPIFYSLGNFFFDYPSSHPLWNKGVIARLKINAKEIKSIKIDFIPVEKTDYTLSISTDQAYKNHLSQLCANLLEPVYSELVEKEMQRLWENRYKSLYLNSLNGVEKFDIIPLLKFLKRLCMKKTIKTEQLRHLLFIESHFYAVNRSLKQQYNQY